MFYSILFQSVDTIMHVCTNIQNHKCHTTNDFSDVSLKDFLHICQDQDTLIEQSLIVINCSSSRFKL